MFIIDKHNVYYMLKSLKDNKYIVITIYSPLHCFYLFNNSSGIVLFKSVKLQLCVGFPIAYLLWGAYRFIWTFICPKRFTVKSVSTKMFCDFSMCNIYFVSLSKAMVSKINLVLFVYTVVPSEMLLKSVKICSFHFANRKTKDRWQMVLKKVHFTTYSSTLWPGKHDLIDVRTLKLW